MKGFILLAAVLICAGAVSANSGISIGSVHEYGNEFSISAVSEEFYASNARFKAVIPELGIVFPAQTADLREDECASILFIADEKIPAGEYLVRITASDGSRRRTSHRYISFG